METKERRKSKTKYLGSQAIGIKKDTRIRGSYKSDFPNGWKTRGTITKYDKKSHKYLIEGDCYIFNESGEFLLNGRTGDWFSRDQIELIDW